MAIRELAPACEQTALSPFRMSTRHPCIAMRRYARGSGQCEELILSGNRVIAEWSAQGEANSAHARNTRASSCAGNLGA